VVWHTQGSGKSLTMLWLALKLRNDPRQDNPTLVIVTDRTDLDDQITKTFPPAASPTPSRPRACATCARCFPGRRARPF
jgi:type I restriction enzyme R subunit